MIGIIDSIEVDTRFDFKGKIVCDDGKYYYFNKMNWSNSNISMGDISVGSVVEFELKNPNASGVVYPKNIRFKGQTIQYSTSHSYGDFKQFVFVKTYLILPLLKKMSPDYCMDDANPEKSVFRKIAQNYNRLSNSDFVFTNTNNTDVLCFPSGYNTHDGVPIFLYCTKNIDPNKSTWESDRVLINNRVVGGSIFELINANWYDVEADIKTLLPQLEAVASDIVRCIETRCIDTDNTVIALRDGMLATLEDADHLYVPTSFSVNQESELYLCCSKRNGFKGYGWYYECVTFENAPLTVYNKKDWLELWADLGTSNLFEDLANETLEEKWSFGSRDDYGILRNYLRYTFAHQWESDCIGFSADRKYAAFNTGLPDRDTYKYLYAFFECNSSKNKAEIHPLHCSPVYRFKGFVKQGRGGDGKLLSSNIRPLPDPPQYFKARSATVWELDFNASGQPTLPEYDDAHILIQRCDRLPLDFYRFRAMSSRRLADMLNSPIDDNEKYKNLREYFRPVIDKKAPSDPDVTQAYRLLKAGLDEVISNAVKKLSWNWRAVVPCYNPEEKKPCFLLPVSFCDYSKPDRALIASSYEIDGELIYQIHTVIPLEWAYLDARLVCRPESEWLAADCIN